MAAIESISREREEEGEGEQQMHAGLWRWARKEKPAAQQSGSLTLFFGRKAPCRLDIAETPSRSD